MAFTVEDGTGLTNSNSYGAVADFKSFHTDRNVTAVVESTYLDTEIQAALIQATDYVDKRFGKRFKGWKQSRAQALEWPRNDAYDDDGYLFADLPQQLKNAIYEYALLALQLARNLAPVPGLEFSTIDTSTGTASAAASGQLKRKTEKVGPIEDTTEYAVGEDASNSQVSSGNMLATKIPEYPQADMWLEDLLTPFSSRSISRG